MAVVLSHWRVGCLVFVVVHWHTRLVILLSDSTLDRSYRGPRLSLLPVRSTTLTRCVQATSWSCEIVAQKRPPAVERPTATSAGAVAADPITVWDRAGDIQL